MDNKLKIESNFDSISSYIMEKTGINLFEPIDEFTEMMGLTGPNDSELSSTIFEVIGRSPEDIWKWMHENISYDKTIQGWTLKTPAEVFKSRTGNCHDQSLFTSFVFHSLGIINGQLFFVEFSKDNPIGGNTHTLTWYRIDTPNEDYKYSYYWFENAWEDQAGIHGPYNDINGLKHAVLEIYKNDHDINQGKYDGIVFSTLSNYRCGMSLGEYVKSWRLQDDHLINESSDDIKTVISESIKWIENFANSDKFQKKAMMEASNAWRHEFIAEWINPTDRLFSNMQGLSTPMQLFKFMNKIKYGWISSDDGQVHGTGEAEDEDYFFKYYRLQSPDELASSLVGVCWDQTEFEREWFKEHGYGHKIYYLELNDGEGCPSHTFASYISKETGRLYWFEHSWNKYAGMHYYKSESELLRDVISKHRKAWDDQSSPVILAELKDTPRYGMTCEEFMNFSHSQPRINVDDLMDVNRNDIITDGIGENVVLPTHTCPECNHTSSNVEVRFDSPVDYDRISQLHPDWDLSKGRIGYIICPKCNTRNDIVVVNENTISPRFLKEIADGISSEPLDEYDPPLPYEQLPEHLKNDPVHVWRAKHGIELIHKEPTLEELNRIWRNWQLMSDEQKIISNNESMKLFGMDNEEHYYALIKEYDALAESHLPYGDIFEEKSHGSLKYCYRIGFDADTGKEVAIQFILDSSKVTKAGDDLNVSFAQQTTGNTEKSVDELNTDALSTLKKNIKKYGYIDFSTDELKVDKIFYKHGSSVNSVKLIPLFSRVVIDVMNSIDHYFLQIKKENLTSNELFESREFQDALVSKIKSSGVVPESYTVGTVTGKGKYKTTKLLWDREALLSYKFTPVLRGFNRYGRGVNVSDMKDYIDKDLNNKFKESCEGDINIMNSMVSVNTFWGESSLTVNIPFNEPLNRFGYPIESDIEDIYIESIVNCIDENGEYVASQLLEKRGKVTGCCSSCGTNLSNEHITDAPKKDYEKVASKFPSWDGRYGKLGMIKCPNCGERNYLISDNDWEESYLAEEGESMPKQTDAAESNKNGVNRKKLYIAFIEWCKEYNNKNTFGSLFDKDVFNVTYPFVPEEMRYFYRLANPLLCVLSGQLTFFQVSELKKLNSENSKLNEMMIFAATPNDMRVFNKKDKKVYKGIDENGQLKLAEVLGNTFDTYIQGMIKKGDILNSPNDEVTEN